MKKNILALGIVLSTILLLISNLFSQASAPLDKDFRMHWWREAKFGMFIHWGLYSIPAGIWNGREYKKIGEWIMSYADIPLTDYEKLAQQFNPVQFDAENWVQLAKEAGMRYLVITSKHHDGFCLFDTKATKYNVMNATPYKNDIVKALSDACKRNGIKFCVYYSILDWHHPAQQLNRGSNDVYGNNLIKPGRKKEYIKYLKAQLEELVTQYDPGVLWFDGGWMDWWTPADGKILMDYLWNLKPDLIINNREAGTEKMEKEMGDFLTPEQFIPSEHAGKDWESCMTMNDTWGYKKNDQNWKPTKVLLFNLIDIVSKGGNFLLNVGPTSDGLIPETSIDRLREIGEWLQVNGEAIYDTKPWIKQREGLHRVEFINSYKDTLTTFQEPDYTAQDILFTSKENTVYAICLAWPETSVTIQSLKGLAKEEIVSVSMLGADIKLTWEINGNGLVIQPPKEKPCDYAFVFKVVK